MKSQKVFTLNDDDYERSDLISHWVISSSLPDHKLVYRINTALSINLHRTKEDHITILKGVRFSHPSFVWEDLREELSWSLITNRGKSSTKENSLFDDFTQSTILPASEKVDYILTLYGDPLQCPIKDVTSALKSVSGVLRVGAHELSKTAREALEIEIENYHSNE